MRTLKALLNVNFSRTLVECKLTGTGERHLLPHVFAGHIRTRGQTQITCMLAT